MKRCICIMLALFLTAAILSACSNKPNTNTQESTPPVSNADSNPQPTKDPSEIPTTEEMPEAPASGIRPETQAAIDSYEEFMDEYIAFMKKYNENPEDLTLMTDYADFMASYAETVENFESLEEGLTEEETVYYLEVLERVNNKLQEIA